MIFEIPEISAMIHSTQQHDSNEHPMSNEHIFHEVTDIETSHQWPPDEFNQIAARPEARVPLEEYCALAGHG